MRPIRNETRNLERTEFVRLMLMIYKQATNLEEILIKWSNGDTGNPDPNKPPSLFYQDELFKKLEGFMTGGDFRFLTSIFFTPEGTRVAAT
jgi:hypothetical protein